MPCGGVLWVVQILRVVQILTYSVRPGYGDELEAVEGGSAGGTVQRRTGSPDAPLYWAMVNQFSCAFPELATAPETDSISPLLPGVLSSHLWTPLHVKATLS